MADSRRKGAAGEREFAGLIHDWLGVRLVRNLDQSRTGGHDLVVADEGPAAAALDRFAIEVKRYARATPGLLSDWWRQTVTQARRCRRIPALAYRGDRQPWQVIVPLAAIHPDLPHGDDLAHCAVLTLPGFAAVVRELHMEAGA